jgi:hypothetical protein
MAIEVSQPSSRFTSGELKAFASTTVKMQREEVKGLKSLQGTH